MLDPRNLISAEHRTTHKCLLQVKGFLAACLPREQCRPLLVQQANYLTFRQHGCLNALQRYTAHSICWIFVAKTLCSSISVYIIQLDWVGVPCLSHWTVRSNGLVLPGGFEIRFRHEPSVKKGQNKIIKNSLPVDDIGFSQGPPRGTEDVYSSLNPVTASRGPESQLTRATWAFSQNSQREPKAWKRKTLLQLGYSEK